jgi:hypothetical protein
MGLIVIFYHPNIDLKAPYLIYQNRFQLFSIFGGHKAPHYQYKVNSDKLE